MNTNTYKNGIISIKGNKDIFFKWLYLGKRKASFNDTETDTFNISVLYDGLKSDFKFYNSISETEITQKLSHQKRFFADTTGVLKILRPKTWGGYDNIKTLQDFKNKRVYYLVYGFVNCFFNDLLSETDTFKNFCDSYGYDENSRKAYEIYTLLMTQKEDPLSVSLLRNEAVLIENGAREENGFNDIIKNAVSNKDTINILDEDF
jgi:hypothetical protein